MYRVWFTTDLTENDMVFGAEEKLLKACIEINSKYNPSAIFVYITCVTAMIGEDIETVCKKASSIIHKPVVPVYSPGFVGSKNLGNKLAGKSLLDYVSGTGEPDFITPFDINLIGEYNIAGELWQVLPMFKCSRS